MIMVIDDALLTEYYTPYFEKDGIDRFVQENFLVLDDLHDTHTYACSYLNRKAICVFYMVKTLPPADLGKWMPWMSYDELSGKPPPRYSPDVDRIVQRLKDRNVLGSQGARGMPGRKMHYGISHVEKILGTKKQRGIIERSLRIMLNSEANRIERS